jgi:hypothetical protein
MSRYKRLYDQLIIDEELFDMFPSLVGEWSIDKKQFITMQQQMEDFSLDTTIEDEEYGG